MSWTGKLPAGRSSFDPYYLGWLYRDLVANQDEVMFARDNRWIKRSRLKLLKSFLERRRDAREESVLGKRSTA